MPSWEERIIEEHRRRRTFEPPKIPPSATVEPRPIGGTLWQADKKATDDIAKMDWDEKIIHGAKGMAKDETGHSWEDDLKNLKIGKGAGGENRFKGVSGLILLGVVTLVAGFLWHPVVMGVKLNFAPLGILFLLVGIVNQAMTPDAKEKLKMRIRGMFRKQK